MNAKTPDNVLLIDEEYGYQAWIAHCSNADLEEAKRLWKTMKGLNCLVPVTMVFPMARRCGFEDWLPWSDEEMIPRRRKEIEGVSVLHVHFHECDDSGIEGMTWKIPESDVFEIDGKKYSDEDLYAMNRPEDN